MNPKAEGRTTLAHALAALRDDLEAQPPPPASVLAAAQRAARQAARMTVPEARPAASGAAAPARGTWRLPRWLGGGRASVQGAVRAGPSRPPGAAGLLGPWGPWAGAATCAAVLGVSLLLALRPPQVPPEAQAGADRRAAGLPGSVRLAGAEPDKGAGARTAAGTGGAGTGAREQSEIALGSVMHFVPLVSPERMRALADRHGAGAAQATADTPAWVVTTELPQERLAAMGLPYDPGHAAEPLRAELLMAGSGEVLAVRLLF